MGETPMQHEHFHKVDNGRRAGPQRVAIEDTIVVERETSRTAIARSEEQEFEVVGIVEDSTSSTRYAVCYCEPSDEFIVTDDAGVLLTDETLAQEILDDFLEQAAGSAEEES
jgi:hypothetical protein